MSWNEFGYLASIPADYKMNYLKYFSHSTAQLLFLDWTNYNLQGRGESPSSAYPFKILGIGSKLVTLINFQFLGMGSEIDMISCETWECFRLPVLSNFETLVIRACVF